MQGSTIPPLSTAAAAELQHVLTLPPTSLPMVHRNNPIAVAHAALEGLRDAGDESFLFLRTVLDLTADMVSSSTSRSAITSVADQPPAIATPAPHVTRIAQEELLFHAITGCRQVSLWRWNSYSSAFSSRLADYFLWLGNAFWLPSDAPRNSISRTCQIACYTTSVCFWKRAWNTDTNNANTINTSNSYTPQEQALVDLMYTAFPEQRSQLQLHPNKEHLFSYLERMIVHGGNWVNTSSTTSPSARADSSSTSTSGNTSIQAAATFMECLVGEFSGKSAVTYRLPLEFHKLAHRAFETQSALQYCLQLSMTAFGCMVGAINSSHSRQLSSPSTAAASDVLSLTTTAHTVVQLVLSVCTWEFGMGAWHTGTLGTATMLSSSSRTLFRPPVAWKNSLGRPDLAPAIFNCLEQVEVLQQSQQQQQLAQSLRQFLLLLASMTGPMFANVQERKILASVMVDGTIRLLQRSTSIMIGNRHHQNMDTAHSSPLVVLPDTLALVARLITNFKLAILVELSPPQQQGHQQQQQQQQPPLLATLLEHVTRTATQLLTDQVRECQQAGGDIDSMADREWREECLEIALDCAVSLCSDPWLLYGGGATTTTTRTEHQQSCDAVSRTQAQSSLSAVLGPLYECFVQGRTQLAALEERYIVANEADLDEVREEIMELNFEEEMTSVAAVGRLHLPSAIACLSSLFAGIMPRLQALWEGESGGGGVSPDAAALLEETRLLVHCISHLLTDDNEGESPQIPDSIIYASCQDESLTRSLAGAVDTVFSLATAQIQRIALDPNNPCLSPLLAKSFLWFLNRFIPSYVNPLDQGSSASTNPILQEWSTLTSASAGLLPTSKAHQTIDVCVNLCLHYQCYWPHEPQVQGMSGKLLHSIARRRGNLRLLMVASGRFQEMVRLHCLTAATRHNASVTELEDCAKKVLYNNGDTAPQLPPTTMLRGYQRLSYSDRAKIFTAILVACSNKSDEASNSMINLSLKVVHDAFTSLVDAIHTKKVDSDDLNAKEMSNLCIEMLCGVAHASEMLDAERIPELLTGYLTQLSGFMSFYAKDLSICEALLRFFRDYTEQFIAMLDKDQSLALFHATADLLKHYSFHHCQQGARVISTYKNRTETKADEDQTYSDVLCAIQLLINMGAKDFIDACDTTKSGGVESTQVTDVIFFGLQQLLPLMTQGLLQFPVLCAYFFELVAFMMDTYPDKVAGLPYELFNSLLESLLFGMSHHDANGVGIHSLQGIASIVKEHMQTNTLANHLAQHDPDIFDRCSRRLLSEVVFQNTVVSDRVEAAGMAMLPLAAVNLTRFAAVVEELTNQIADEQQRSRLRLAFQKLIQPDVIAKISLAGYDGRMNRVRFKKDFEEFVNEIHSFLVVK